MPVPPEDIGVPETFFVGVPKTFSRRHFPEDIFAAATNSVP